MTDGEVPEGRPQWILRQYASKTGRDHLGLNAVNSGEILADLSPSINVLTLHPRYHSFYCFVLKQYWDRYPKKSRSTWKRFYRACELVFSVAANLCDHAEHRDVVGIVGSGSTGPLAHSGNEFEQDFHYMDSPYGGYGLYYRTVMMDMGLVLPGGPGFEYPVDMLTPELGRPLADAFEEAVADTTFVKDYLGNLDRPVPIDVAREFGRRACLCQLMTDGCPDQPLLNEIFLEKGWRPQDRRATLRLFLDIADSTDGFGLTAAVFRRLVFYGRSRDGAIYSPSEKCAARAAEWRLYQAREYYVYALNWLWRHFCEWGVASGGTRMAVSPAQYWTHLAQACDMKPIVAALGISEEAPSGDMTMRGLLDWIARCNGASVEDFDARSGLDAPFSEDRLCELVTQPVPPDAAQVAGMLVVLAMTLLRFGAPARASAADWRIARMGGAERLSMDCFCREVEEKQLLDLTIPEFAQWITEYYVISQHIGVAAGKLPENTFRFNYDSGGLLFYDLDNPISFNDARFTSVSTTAHELGLCGDLREDDHPLTSTGRRLLETGQL